MKKKLFFAFFMVVLFLSVPIFAAEERGVYDDANLLNNVQIAELDKKIDEIAEKYNFYLMILTVKSMDGEEDAIDYSWHFLDSYGLYGEGENTWDGCLLLQSTGDRDYAFTASGRGKKILNEAAYDKLEKDVVACLKRDDYVGAYKTYISTWERFLILESQGKRYNILRETKTHVGALGALWLVALLIGIIAVNSMKKKMNNVHPKTEADTYIIPGSLALTQQSDTFLYSTVTKTKRESSSGGGSSSSGGGRSSRSGKY